VPLDRLSHPPGVSKPYLSEESRESSNRVTSQILMADEDPVRMAGVEGDECGVHHQPHQTSMIDKIAASCCHPLDDTFEGPQ
jgi:hypothetical protein